MDSGSPSYRGTRRWVPLTLALCGLSLVLAAGLLSSERLETVLLGEASGKLAWGPDLFRMLLGVHGIVLLGLAAALGKTDSGNTLGSGTSALGAYSELEDVPLKIRWILGAILLVGLALRLFRLDQGLWLDEVLTLLDFVRLRLGEIVSTFPSQNQHMLYSVLARISTAILGESAATLRLPAALFGVGSLAVLFFLGRWTNGNREALLAVLLMTVSYHHIWFSQNARGYSGLLFFTLLATWMWLRACSTGGLLSWGSYAMALALGTWIHLTMLFVALSHVLVFLAGLLVDRSPRPDPTRTSGFRLAPLAAWGLAGTTTVQLLALSLPEFLRTALHEEALESSDWTEPYWFLREAIRRLGDIGLFGLFLIAATAVLAIGWVSQLRRDWRSALVMVLPGVLGGATMIALGHPLWPRFFFFCLGFLMLTLVRGLTVCSHWLAVAAGRYLNPAMSGERLASAIVLLLAGASLLMVPRAYLPKQDFIGAREFVEKNKGQSDAAVAVGLLSDVYKRYYAPDWYGVEAVSELNHLETTHRIVWVAYTLPVHLRAWYPEVWRTLEEDYDVVKVLQGTLGDGDIVICRSKREEAE